MQVARKKRKKKLPPKSSVWRSPNPDDEFAFNLRDRDEEQGFGLAERFSRPIRSERRIRRVRRQKVKDAYSYLRKVKGRKRRVRIHVPAQYRKRITVRVSVSEETPKRICADVIVYYHDPEEGTRERVSAFTATFQPGRDRQEFWSNYFAAIRAGLAELGSDPSYTAKQLGYEVIVTKVYAC